MCAEPFLRALYFLQGIGQKAPGYLTWLVADGLAMSSILAMAVRLRGGEGNAWLYLLSRRLARLLQWLYAGRDSEY